MRTLACPPLALLVLTAAAHAQKRPFTADDLVSMKRLGDPQLSPDGRTIVFTVRTTDWAANRGRTDLWLASTDGQTVRPLTTHPASESNPRWSRDGKKVYFLSPRGGSTQLWEIPIDGGEASQVSNFPLDVGCFVAGPDDLFILTMEVYPGTTPGETAERDRAREQNPVKARVYDELLYRHWDAWRDGKRSHVFSWRRGGEPVDLMRSMDADCPTRPFGGPEEIALSPDGTTVVFAAKNVGRESAWSTNVDLWAAGIDGRDAQPKNLTEKNRALDNLPAFSPDGSRLAYVAMARPGFEADRQVIWIRDLASGTSKPLTEGWDRSASSLTWSCDGRFLFTTADDLGNHRIFAVPLEGGTPEAIDQPGTFSDVCAGADSLYFLHDTLSRPAELYTQKAGSSEIKALTHFNDEACAAIAWGAHEQFTFLGAHGDTVYAYVVKPPGLADGAKAPVACLVHGGPQGSFGNHFHYRWNPQFYAGRGYAALFIDFHGSTGYGQKFTDSISGDWGGAPFEDVMKGLDAALVKYPWLDGTRCAALGASYGGYMMNWINGNTDRFRCIVTHASNLDERMAYFDTEELWFPEWEHGGTPWENPAGYAKHNPIDFVKNWKTPTLVTHGALDFRVVDAQGLSVFTALQRKGVPSRLLYFPDENHWILKPHNSKFWHEQVGAWLDRWLK